MQISCNDLNCILNHLWFNLQQMGIQMSSQTVGPRRSWITIDLSGEQETTASLIFDPDKVTLPFKVVRDDYLDRSSTKVLRIFNNCLGIECRIEGIYLVFPGYIVQKVRFNRF